MAAAALAAFIATFNETFLNVGFTHIMADFGIGVATVQWLATAYMLGAAVMTPTAGFFMRRFSTKPLFLATTSTWIIGGVITAIAPSFGWLLAGRIIQSVGTGLLVPIGMMIVLTVAPRPKLGTFMGVMGAMTTLGPSIAILASGVILEFSTWRGLCWAFTGLGVIVFLVGMATVYNISDNVKADLDVPSVILVALVLIGLLYGISTIFGPAKLVALSALLVGIIALVFFVKRQNSIDDPLVNLKPLSVYPFAAGVIINVIALIVVFSMNILVPMHLQSVHGATGLQASLVLFPAIMLAVIFGPVAGKIYDTHGAKIILPLGMLLMAVFSLATSWAMGQDKLWVMTALYMPAILGSALAIGPVQSFSLSSLPRALNPPRRDHFLHVLPGGGLRGHGTVHRHLRRHRCLRRGPRRQPRLPRGGCSTLRPRDRRCGARLDRHPRPHLEHCIHYPGSGRGAVQQRVRYSGCLADAHGRLLPLAERYDQAGAAYVRR